jgi:ferritin-like metal-binding protein YciE
MAPTTKTPTKATASSKSPEAESALKELFVDELKDILWAEKHLTSALKKMAKEATSEELKEAFTTHLSQTGEQINRLEEVFASVGEKATTKKCEAMAGLIKEAEGIIEDTEKGTETRDAGLISAAQKVEHYEIASYGTLKTFAARLGYSDAQALIEQTLAEEKDTDSLLTNIAESFVNEAALNEAG